MSMIRTDAQANVGGTSIVARWIIFAAVLCGAWASGRLVGAHDGGWHAGESDAAQVVSPCGLRSLPSATCAEVVESRWGSFDFYVGHRRFLIPTSLVGFAYFVFLGVWVIIAPPGVHESRALCRAWRWVTVAGAVGSVFLVGVMGLTLDAWCSDCLMIHAVNAVVLMGVWWMTRRPPTRGDRGESSPNTALPASPLLGRLVVSACVLSLCGVFGAWLYFEAVADAKQEWRKAAAYRKAYESLREDPDLVMRAFLAQPRVSLPDREIALVNDTANGPHIIFFTDFDCPACACFQRAWHEDLFPDSNGTPLVDVRFLPRGAIHDDQSRNDSESERAARAAVAARMQAGESGLTRITALLFAHRHTANGRNYAALAQAAGFDVDRFIRDMNSPSARERIQGDVALAKAIGVDATPVVYVNGRRVPPLCLNSKAFWSTVARSSHSLAPGARVSKAGIVP